MTGLFVPSSNTQSIEISNQAFGDSPSTLSAFLFSATVLEASEYRHFGECMTNNDSALAIHRRLKSNFCSIQLSNSLPTRGCYRLIENRLLNLAQLP